MAKLALLRIEGISIPLAPLREKHRIVAKLDHLRARSARACQELDHIPKLIERYKQAILAKAFSGELTADWRGGQQRLKSGHDVVLEAGESCIRIRRSKMPNRKLVKMDDLPASWGTARLEDLSSCIVDGTHHTPNYVEAGVPFVSVKDIYDYGIHFDDCKYVTEAMHAELSKRCEPVCGDVLVTKSGTIGRCAVVPAEIRFSLFVSVALIRPATESIVPSFLMRALEYWIGTIDVSQEIVGFAIKNLHLQDIKALEMPVPSTEEQMEIVRRIDHAFAWLDKIATEHARADHLLPKLDQAILAKAFRGELVPQDPNDEPASVLLERIRAEREAEKANKPKQRRRRAKAAS